MLSPFVPPRIEEGNILTSHRVRCGHSRRLAERAGNTCQCKVIQCRCPAANTRENVINVKGCFLRFLGKTTILANVTSPLTHSPDQRSQDVAAHESACPETRFVRSLSNASMSTRSVSASASWRSVSDSDPSLSCRSRSVCNRASRAEGKRNCSQSSGNSS